MFLNSLNSDQKNLFIELAIKAAESNEIVALEQKNMLKAFAIEMNIVPVYTTEHNTKDIIDNLIRISTEKDLKIILFEILAIIVSDAVFDEQEKEFIKNIVRECNINSELVDKMISLLRNYDKLYREILATVM